MKYRVEGVGLKARSLGFRVQASLFGQLRVMIVQEFFAGYRTCGIRFMF
jgi:hypothetical protein